MTDDIPLIVGIGALAGGIRAISTFLENVPDASGLAFAIVTHLSPHHESKLCEVLQHKTEMKVETARDGTRMRAETVYVMPERATMTIRDGCLLLSDLADSTRERHPIDIFFSALAEDQRENAAAVVLSGGDGDGTLGVKVVKEYGGVTFAQIEDGEPPLNPEMPESAIASGFVDFAIPVHEMGARLVALQNGRAALDALVVPSSEDKDGAGTDRVQAAIAGILDKETGHDFSGYKPKTFFRRVARRMQVRQVSDLEDYCDLLRRDGAEVNALFSDLLISVTNFFRDEDAFDALRDKVIPRLLEGRDVDDPLRIWVPACTTGEEAYSLAILVHEHVEKSNRPVKVQIFATDIDDAALSVARQGRYPVQLLGNVSDERRERYFRKDGAAYVVRKQIRDMCIFSPHNLISDPPFSRMDMVSCRNLLIYFGPDLQKQVLPTFHYALKTGGYLFLGTSESISRFDHLFRTVDKHHRIFQAREHAHREWHPPAFLQRERGPEDGEEMRQTAFSGIQLRHRVERQVLERHAPPHVVVRGDGEVAYFSAGTGGFLEVPRGQPSRQLLDMVRRDLRPDLRTLLHDVARSHVAQSRRVRIGRRGDGEEWIVLRIEPLEGTNGYDPLFLVVFDPLAPASAPATGSAAPDGHNEAVEHELREMRERLQATVEEYETALEELKSANEELVSVNEEAQSTNEELEASREEMEALNEELNTINAELNGKVEELDSANCDLRNLFDATSIATVFLDCDLVIRNFTPAAAELFSLRPADIGRPLSELASVRHYPDLRDHIRAVFESGETCEHRLSRGENGAHYLVRLHPYRGEDSDIQGAVVTFVDVTQLAEAEAQQKVLIAELNHRVKNMLTVALGVVKATLAQGESVEKIREVLLPRLRNMARAYGLLSESAWTPVGMREIIALERDAFEADRFEISGPDLRLDASQALSVSMILHELTTNAVKYGALSTPEGRVAVHWENDDGCLRMRWDERDGPSVSEEATKGFGYSLIKGQVELQLGGSMERHLDREGLSLVLEFPLTN